MGADVNDFQPTQPTEDSVVINQFKGLKNTVSAERLRANELVRALNVDIDDVGQIHRRRGYTRKATGNFHSLYNNGVRTFVVKDNTLSVVNPDYTFIGIKTNIGPGPLAYVTVGDNTYFTSAVTSGYVNNTTLTVYPWGQNGGDGLWLSPVVNPTATLGQVDGKYLGAPPLATDMDWFQGRIYMAQGNVLWATELYNYNYVDQTKNYYYFEDPITIVGAVTDGFYVGTTRAVYFMSGTFNALKREPLTSYGAIPGSLVYVPVELIHPEDSMPNSKNAVVFMTTSGLNAGFDDGVCYNLTQNDVLLPDMVSMPAMFRRQDGVNQYVGVANSAGTPSSTARIGDYADAEIRRFSGA